MCSNRNVKTMHQIWKTNIRCEDENNSIPYVDEKQAMKNSRCGCCVDDIENDHDIDVHARNENIRKWNLIELLFVKVG